MARKAPIKKIICWDDYVGYPVGVNFTEAVTFTEKAAEQFNKIKKFKGKYVNLWCRGSSGAILSSLFGSKIANAVRICHVKKTGESSHNPEANPAGIAINVIIDDFCESGNTLNAIFHQLQEELTNNTEVDCLIIGTTPRTVAERRLQLRLKFRPQIIITNSIKP